MPKEIPLSAAQRPLGDYALGLRKDEVLIVSHPRRPIAAVVSLHGIDRESVFLAFHPKFLRILEKSRARMAAGRTYTLAEVSEVVFGKRRLRSHGSRRSPRRAVAKRAL